MRFPLNLDFSVRSQVFRCLLLTYCLRCFLVGERRIWPLLVEAADLEPALKHLGFLYLTVVSGNGRPCGVTHQQYSVSAWHWTGAYDPSRRQAGRAPCRAVSLAERHAGVSGYKSYAKSFVRLEFDFGFIFLATCVDLVHFSVNCTKCKQDTWYEFCFSCLHLVCKQEERSFSVSCLHLAYSVLGT